MGLEAALAVTALSAILFAVSDVRSRSAAAVASLLVNSLEHRFQPAQIIDAQDITGVIALGGGTERIREACRLAQRHPHFKVFISGAGDEATIRSILGPDLADCRVMHEEASRNTRDNAHFSKAALAPVPDQRWLLVTSAAHMPRAMGAFRKAGFPVEPWPVRDAAPGLGAMLAVARHEWLGLVAYWLAGRTSELFPRP